MTIILLVLLVLFVVLLAISYIPLKLRFYLNTDTADAHASAAWPFMKTEVTLMDGRVFLCVFLFKFRIFSRLLKHHQKEPKTSVIQTLKALELNKTTLDIEYGLNEPYFTGMLYVMIDYFAAVFNIAEVNINPDFLPDTEYMTIDANADLHVASTIMNFLKEK